MASKTEQLLSVMKIVRKDSEEEMEAVKDMLNRQEERGLSQAFDEETYNDMQKFAREGQIEKVIELLDKGVDADTWEGNTLTQGITPLMLAVHGKHLECAKVLIDRGANIHASIKKIQVKGWGFSSDEGSRFFYTGRTLEQSWTPVHFASNVADVNMIEFLLQEGAFVTHEDYPKPMYTLFNGIGTDDDIVKCLKVFVKAGVDVNEVGVEWKGPDEEPYNCLDHMEEAYETPLHAACKRLKCARLIRELQRYGAHGKTTNYIKSPSVIIIESTHDSMEENLDAFIDCYGTEHEIYFSFDFGRNKTAHLYTTLLYAAVYKRMADVVHWLLKRGADIHPFMGRNDHDDEMPYRLQQYDLLCAVLHNRFYQTYEEFAEEFAMYDIVKLLLEKGYNPNETRKFSTDVFEYSYDQECTAIQYCTLMQRPALVDLLLRYKADPNIYLEKKTIITCCACPSSNKGLGPELLEKLLKAGLNPNLVNSDGHSGLLALLIDNECPKKNAATFTSVLKRDYSATDRDYHTVEEGPNFRKEEHDLMWNIIGHDAVKKARKALEEKKFQVLIDRGASACIDDPFSLSIGCDASRCMKVLLKFGAFESKSRLIEGLEAMICLKGLWKEEIHNTVVALCSLNKANVLYYAGLIDRRDYLRLMNLYLCFCGMKSIPEDAVNEIPPLQELARATVMRNLKTRDEETFNSLELPVTLKSTMCYMHTNGAPPKQQIIFQYWKRYTCKLQKCNWDEREHVRNNLEQIQQQNKILIEIRERWGRAPITPCLPCIGSAPSDSEESETASDFEDTD